MERRRAVDLLSVVADPAVDLPGVAELATRLLEAGLVLKGRRILPAEDGPVTTALRQAVEEAGLVVAVGDAEGAAVLRAAMARLTGTRLVLSERALQAVTAAYAARDRALPGRAEGLALVPQGATLLLAADGGEPGILAEVEGALVAVLPAAPATAAALLAEHLLPRVTPQVGSRRSWCGRSASWPWTPDRSRAPWPTSSEARTASRRPAGRATASWRVRLRVRAASIATAQARWPALEAAFRAALGGAWYGEGEATLEGATGRLLRAEGLHGGPGRVCTGGLVGHRLTQVPGSSAYVDRGFVVYSNAAKEALLGVPGEILRTHGAVSAPCVEAMARGVRARAGTTLGLGVTGIAGPDGGTPTKPVGTVFVGLADAEGAWTRRYCFGGDRAGNKALSATAALDALRRYGLGGLAALDA